MKKLSDLPAYLLREERLLLDGTKRGLYDLAEQVILRTPVDKGNMRANWNPSTDAPDVAVRPFNDDEGTRVQAPQRSAGSDRAMNKVRQMARRAVGRVFHLTNAVHYAADIEYGKSAQAPTGMVRLVGVRAIEVLKNAFRETAAQRIDNMATKF